MESRLNVRILHRLTFIFCLSFLADSALAEQTIRVAIGRSESQVRLSGKDLKALVRDEGNKKDIVFEGALLDFTLSKGELSCLGKRIPTQQVLVTSPGVIKVFGRTYRNNLEVLVNHTDNKSEMVLVHTVPIESYLVGIVSSEVPNNWHMNALKAQAITARTYALWQKFRRLNNSYHVESTVADQVYNGSAHEHPRSEQAVKETEGLVMSYNDQLVEAYFHSTCGDHTESAKEGWGKNIAYLPGVMCGYCKNAKTHNWQLKLPRKELDAIVKPLLGEHVLALEITQKTSTGRIKTIQLKGAQGHKNMSGLDFRNLIGNTRLKSTWVTQIAFSNHSVIFSGQGYGHGIGLCQYGALGMAKADKKPEEILQHYFPGIILRKMY